MAEDTSLDDFRSDESDGAGSEKDAADDESDPAPDRTPTSATTTYAWSGDGAACESCGEVVERRWQQDGALVCVDCKAWGE